MSSIRLSNEWIEKNQGRAHQIMQENFIEKMQRYDKFKRDFVCEDDEDLEMVYC